MWVKIITIKRTKDLNYFDLCAFNLFNTWVSQFELNYWNKWTFPRHSNLLRCTCTCFFLLYKWTSNTSILCSFDLKKHTVTLPFPFLFLFYLLFDLFKKTSYYVYCIRLNETCHSTFILLWFCWLWLLLLSSFVNRFEKKHLLNINILCDVQRVSCYLRNGFYFWNSSNWRPIIEMYSLVDRWINANIENNLTALIAIPVQKHTLKKSCMYWLPCRAGILALNCSKSSEHCLLFSITDSSKRPSNTNTQVKLEITWSEQTTLRIFLWFQSFTYLSIYFYLTFKESSWWKFLDICRYYNFWPALFGWMEGWMEGWMDGWMVL